MNTPESSPADKRKSELRIEFTGLMRRFILEGLVNVSDGTDFTIVQADTGPPFEPLSSIADRGKHVITVGIPDPIENEFKYLTMTDEEWAQFDAESVEFLERFKERFGGDTKPEDDTDGNV